MYGARSSSRCSAANSPKQADRASRSFVDVFSSSVDSFANNSANSSLNTSRSRLNFLRCFRTSNRKITRAHGKNSSEDCNCPIFRHITIEDSCNASSTEFQSGSSARANPASSRSCFKKSDRKEPSSNCVSSFFISKGRGK